MHDVTLLVRMRFEHRAEAQLHAVAMSIGGETRHMLGNAAWPPEISTGVFYYE